MREVAAAEDAVPVRVVGLAAPERVPSHGQPRIAGALTFRGGHGLRKTQHLPVGVGDFSIFDDERTPEAAA